MTSDNVISRLTCLWKSTCYKRGYQENQTPGPYYDSINRLRATNSARYILEWSGLFFANDFFHLGDTRIYLSNCTWFLYPCDSFVSWKFIRNTNINAKSECKIECFRWNIWTFDFTQYHSLLNSITIQYILSELAYGLEHHIES